MEVGLGPGYIMLDGDTAPLPKRGHSPPNFGPCLFVANDIPKYVTQWLWQNGWMDQDATWYGGRPWPRPQFVLDGDLELP